MDATPIKLGQQLYRDKMHLLERLLVSRMTKIRVTCTLTRIKAARTTTTKRISNECTSHQKLELAMIS